MNHSHLPQLDLLPGLVARLQALPVVKAVWLGGSLGRGGGDQYSDLDLQVLVEPAFTDFLSNADLAHIAGAPPVATVRFTLGPNTWMHHLILSAGVLVDLLFRHQVSPDETRSWLRLDAESTPDIGRVCTPATGPWTPASTDREKVQDLMQAFWVTMHKHRRGIARAQELVIWTGIHLSTTQLMRLQFIAVRGRDCGDLTRMGIYSLSAVSDHLQRQGQDALFADILHQIQGLDWTACVEQLMYRGHIVCGTLCQQWQITDTQALAQVVAAAWQQFVETG